MGYCLSSPVAAYPMVEAELDAAAPPPDATGRACATERPAWQCPKAGQQAPRAQPSRPATQWQSSVHLLMAESQLHCLSQQVASSQVLTPAELR